MEGRLDNILSSKSLFHSCLWHKRRVLFRKEANMKNISYYFLGMAVQAFCVGVLQAINFIKVTPAQQILAAIFFLIIMAVTIVKK